MSGIRSRTYAVPSVMSPDRSQVSPQSSLSLRLREDTAPHHRRLETALDLLRADLGREDYLSILRAFHDFLLPWEQSVSSVLDAPEYRDLQQRRHVWRLAQDICNLTGHAPQDLGSENCSALPELGSPAAALGSMYVIEGSTLGGQVIGAHMEKKFGFTPEHGCAYFSGYGAQNGRMWSAFRTRLDESVAVGEHDVAVRAAIETFDCLHAWLKEKGVLKGAASA